jgi:phosphoadenosine phosphosulfate reductase
MTTVDTTDLRRLAEDAGRDLEGAHPSEILAWAGRTFGSDLVVASSMGDEVLVDLAAKAVPGIDVIFLDTGYHFAETLGTRDYYADFTDISLRTILPLRTVAEQDAEHGPQLHDRDPNLCCALRKVEPLDRALDRYDAWAAGLRRDESPTRANTPVVGFDPKRGKVKVNPIAAWSQSDVDSYISRWNVPVNELFKQGYGSIGCWPCTRRTKAGEDPRAGRWAMFDKTECGLHV